MSNGSIHAFAQQCSVCESHEPVKSVWESFTSTKQGTELESLVQFFGLLFSFSIEYGSASFGIATQELQPVVLLPLRIFH